MKKINILLNIILSLLYIPAVVFYCITNLMWLKWIIFWEVLLQVLFNLAFAIFSKKLSLKSVLIFIGCIAQVLAFVYFTYYPIISMSLFAFAGVLYCVAISIKNRFAWSDIILTICVAVPMLGLIFFGGIVGFSNTITSIFVVAYIILFSLIVGKSLGNFLNKRNSAIVLEFVASIMLLISNIILLLYYFSYISYYVVIVFSSTVIVDVVLYFLTDLMCWLDEKQIDVCEEKSKLNWGKIVATALLTIFISFSTFAVFSNLEIAAAKISKEQFYALVGNDLNIPVIEINTQNGIFPTSKEEYVNASFSIFNMENKDEEIKIEMTDNYEDEGSFGIRLRGNSTKIAKKKPFRIKFDDKYSFFGLKENKSWVLLADYYDQSYMRNFSAFSLASNLKDNLGFTPSPNHVALILNGDFYGLYLMCEQIDENKGRTDVKKDFDVSTDTDFPFLVEMDQMAYLEGKTGIDNFYVDGFYPVEIKYPELEERGKTETEDKVFDYINEYINAVFYTLKTGETINVSFRVNPVGFFDLVDISSAVDYYIITELMHNPDSIYKSIYMHKEKGADKKMKLGPIWDFDYSLTWAFDLPYKKSDIGTARDICIGATSLIFNKLLNNADFYKEVQDRFNSVKDDFLITIKSLREYKQKIDEVACIDAKIWHGKTGVFQYGMQYDYVRLYLHDRLEYLYLIFNKTHAEFLELI